ncbi:MAG: hypothetical protein HOE90_17120 [Bacteriovoracaceae bacterium]|nr:hypothetical protein [Bacteriovoracaceae bacterium]
MRVKRSANAQLDISRRFKAFLKRLLLSSQGFPIVLCFVTLLILTILFRMKNVEQNLSFNQFRSQIEKLSFENKELKAEKAELLSVNNLRRFAKRYKLKEPSEKQIIVIP